MEEKLIRQLKQLKNIRLDEVERMVLKYKLLKNMNKYSYLKTLKKGLKYALIFVVAAVINKFVIEFPELASYQMGPYIVSGLLVMLLNWLKIKVGFNPTFYGKEIL